MSKRKRKAKKRTSKRRRRSKSNVETVPPIPDRRAMEGVMQQFLSGLGGGGDTALGRAQELMYEAFEADPRRQIALAKQALDICPDCADALVLLAEHAPTLEKSTTPVESGLLQLPAARIIPHRQLSGQLQVLSDKVEDFLAPEPLGGSKVEFEWRRVEVDQMPSIFDC